MVYPKGKNTVYPVLHASNIIYIFQFARECMATEILSHITRTLQKTHFELLNGSNIKVLYCIVLVSSEHTIFSCLYVVHVITYLEAFAESLRGDKSAQEEIIISSN